MIAVKYFNWNDLLNFIINQKFGLNIKNKIKSKNSKLN